MFLRLRPIEAAAHFDSRVAGLRWRPSHTSLMKPRTISGHVRCVLTSTYLDVNKASLARFHSTTSAAHSLSLGHTDDVPTGNCFFLNLLLVIRKWSKTLSIGNNAHQSASFILVQKMSLVFESFIGQLVDWLMGVAWHLM